MMRGCFLALALIATACAGSTEATGAASPAEKTAKDRASALVTDVTGPNVPVTWQACVDDEECVTAWVAAPGANCETGKEYPMNKRFLERVNNRLDCVESHAQGHAPMCADEVCALPGGGPMP